jgi:hypothetical protein
MNLKRTILCAFLMIVCIFVIRFLDKDKKKIEGLRGMIRDFARDFYNGYGGLKGGGYYDDYSDYPYYYPYVNEYPYTNPNYSYPYYY